MLDLVKLSPPPPLFRVKPSQPPLKSPISPAATSIYSLCKFGGRRLSVLLFEFQSLLASALSRFTLEQHWATSTSTTTRRHTSLVSSALFLPNCRKGPSGLVPSSISSIALSTTAPHEAGHTAVEFAMANIAAVQASAIFRRVSSRPSSWSPQRGAFGNATCSY